MADTFGAPGHTGEPAAPPPAALPPAALPWVRVRLRAAPGAALALFALVLATAFLAAALPRAVDRYEDRALRQAVAEAAPKDRGVDLTDTYDSFQPGAATDPLSPAAVDLVEQRFQQLVRPPVRLAEGAPSTGCGPAPSPTSPIPGYPGSANTCPAPIWSRRPRWPRTPGW